MGHENGDNKGKTRDVLGMPDETDPLIDRAPTVIMNCHLSFCTIVKYLSKITFISFEVFI